MAAKAAIVSRLARRERRRERSREEILDAARNVLLREGVAATTLEAVAGEAGMSKTGLYYYFSSKDALLFELVHAAFEAQARAVQDAVEKTASGGEALGAIIRQTAGAFASRLDDFRLAFLFGQVAGPGAVRWSEEQFARIRPLNELCLAGAARRLKERRGKRQGGAEVEPRLMAFLAYLATIGLLTMKGMVESLDDPLKYSDEQMIEGLARIFAAAARA
jgi:AcrR family transcriptional regulator